MMNSSDEENLSRLLTGIGVELDIPESVARLAVARYDALGAHLANFADERGGAEWSIYPQGSFRLGTVVKPLLAHDEYDVDLVCVHTVDKSSVTQVELKELVGKALDNYAASDHPHAPDAVDPGKRCWTLGYGEQFHMDVLPAVPRTNTGIYLTDTGHHRWLESDPIGYSNWFRSTTIDQWTARREFIAKEARSSVEDVPEWQVRTPLQRGVQVIKRHRDLYFKDMPDYRPPSILITTLVARSYNGTPNVYEIVRRAAELLPRLVEDRSGVLWVPNPVCEAENFADRWQTSPKAHEQFVAWTTDLLATAQEIANPIGLDKVVGRLSKSLGGAEVRKASAVFGDAMRTAREAGHVKVTSAGVLGVGAAAAGRSVRDHRFFGYEADR